VLGAPACKPPSPLSNGEIEGTPSEGISLWGLTFGLPMVSGRQVKIVWRMTGTGPLAVKLVGPDGATRSLAWGPEYHLSSSYHRPGQEWGTGFAFDRPGCWRIELSRTIGRGEVYLQILPTT
jgi:hypothetical protein